MSPKWIGCVIAYNEEGLLPGCLKSLRPHVDQLVVVEGRIADFPGHGATSTDDTLRVAHRYADTVITPDLHPWPTEQDMRSRYLVGEPGDWYIILDADETLLTPLPDSATLTEDVYRVPLYMLGTDEHCLVRRLYRDTGRMHYRHAHDALYTGDRLVSNGDETALPHVQVFHRQPLRSKERRALKRIKRKKTQAREKEFRNQLAEWMHANV